MPEHAWSLASIMDRLHLFFFLSDVGTPRSLTTKLAIVSSGFPSWESSPLRGCWVVVFLDYEICGLGHRK